MTSPLKGISERLPLHAFVGDETVAASPEFLKLLETHERLLDVLKTGGDHKALLAECIELGRPLEISLERFFSKIETRLDDFAAEGTG